MSHFNPKKQHEIHHENGMKSNVETRRLFKIKKYVKVVTPDLNSSRRTAAPWKVNMWGPKAWSVQVHSPWELVGLVTLTLGIARRRHGHQPWCRHGPSSEPATESSGIRNLGRKDLQRNHDFVGPVEFKVPRILEVRTQATCHTIKLRHSKWQALLASLCSICTSVYTFSYSELVETSLTRMV